MLKKSHYSLRVEGHFSSAHNLRHYKGKCESLHGHNWKVEIEVCADKLDKKGMLLDFQFLKKCLKNVLLDLDHKYLNEIAYFKKVNPTSENICRSIYKRLSPQIKNLVSVTVWESEGSSATYHG